MGYTVSRVNVGNTEKSGGDTNKLDTTSLSNVSSGGKVGNREFDSKEDAAEGETSDY
jgi:hypothetical protein